MSFFDRAREAVGKAAAAVSRETEVIALQTQLGNADTELQQILVEASKRARELQRAGKLQDRELEMVLQRADDIEARMMDLRQQVQNLQSGKSATGAAEVAPKCPQCGGDIVAGAAFCPHCGSKLN